jgi:hypothetical protein
LKAQELDEKMVLGKEELQQEIEDSAREIKIEIPKYLWD